MTSRKSSPKPASVLKARTGISGFDEVTRGGLPAGRVTLVCGGPGSGKTLFALEALLGDAHNASRGEPSVLVSFDEPPEAIATNAASVGIDVQSFLSRGILHIEHAPIGDTSSRASGGFDLEGLFARIEAAIAKTRARRVALDAIDILFDGLPDRSTVRAEITRLFRWLRARGLTTLVTAERSENPRSLTRDGIEEYAADCVIVLDQRVVNEVATRRLHIVKYRGSAHGTNEFPFLIDSRGLSIVPITGLRLAQAAPRERISSGIPGLDKMLGGRGYHRGASILLTGSAGTGKTTFAAAFVEAACKRGEKALFVSFEESPATLIRDLRPLGIDLGRWVKSGHLRMESMRPTMVGLETHVAAMSRLVEEFQPSVAVTDPISALEHVGTTREVKNTVTLMSDMFRARGATFLATYLLHSAADVPETELGISSAMDVWITMYPEHGDARGRRLRVVKARGSRNASDDRPFRMTRKGITIDAISARR